MRKLLADVDLPAGTQVLGPVPVTQAGALAYDATDDANLRFLIRAPRSAGAALAAALRAGQALRSARKGAGSVRLQLDPAELI